MTGTDMPSPIARAVAFSRGLMRRGEFAFRMAWMDGYPWEAGRWDVEVPLTFEQREAVRAAREAERRIAQEIPMRLLPPAERFDATLFFDPTSGIREIDPKKAAR